MSSLAFLNGLPTEAMELWNEWAETYLIELEADNSGHELSRKFVRDHFDQLHDGSEMLWEKRFDKSNDESALHRAMILKSKSEAAFAAEQMLKPLTDRPDASELWDLNADEIASRVTPAKRREVPEGVEVITAFVDTQQRVPAVRCHGLHDDGAGIRSRLRRRSLTRKRPTGPKRRWRERSPMSSVRWR